MSDQAKAATDTIAQNTPDSAKQAPQQPTEKPRVKADELPPDALKARLDDAKKSAQRELLTELGVSDVADVRAALDELNKRRDAEKTELDRLRDQAQQLDGKAKKADRYSEIIQRRAMGEMAALNEAQRAAVKELAGEDVAEQLRAIDVLRSTWASQPPAKLEPQQVQASAATAPQANAPPEGTVTQPDHKAVYESLRESNPFEATVYLQQYYTDVFPTQ